MMDGLFPFDGATALKKSILLDGTEQRFFEQLMPAHLKLDFARDQAGGYLNSITNSLYAGFLIGQLAGIAQGTQITKLVFDQAYAEATKGANWAHAEVGTSAGLRVIDELIASSGKDMFVMSDLQGGSEAFGATAMIVHGEIVRTMVTEQHLACVDKAS
jgi:hypothetical protein